MQRTEEEVQLWYKLYLKASFAKDIDKQFNTDCRYHFRKRGLPPIDTSATRMKRSGRYKILNYLDEINSEIDSYILGIWFADGTIVNNQAKLTLHNDDKELLLRIRDYICPELKLKGENNNLNLVVSSRRFVSNLEKHGILRRKSYTHFHIPNLKEELIPHFIRGYFDGDGTVYKDRTFLRVSICSITDTILLDIQNILLGNGVESKINTEIREGKTFKVPTGYTNKCHNVHRLYIRKKKSLILLFEYLYKNSTIHLNRKFKTYQNHINTEVSNQIAKG